MAKVKYTAFSELEELSDNVSVDNLIIPISNDKAKENEATNAQIYKVSIGQVLKQSKMIDDLRNRLAVLEKYVYKLTVDGNDLNVEKVTVDGENTELWGQS